MNEVAPNGRDFWAVATLVLARWLLVVLVAAALAALGLAHALSAPAQLIVQRYIEVDTGGASATASAERTVENVVQAMSDPAFQSEIVDITGVDIPYSVTAVRNSDFLVVSSQGESTAAPTAVLGAVVEEYQSRRAAAVTREQERLQSEYGPRLGALSKEITALSRGGSGDLVLARVTPLIEERTRLQSELATRSDAIEVGLAAIRDGQQSVSSESLTTVLFRAALLPAALGLALAAAAALLLGFFSRRLRFPSEAAVLMPAGSLHQRFQASASTPSTALRDALLVLAQRLNGADGNARVAIIGRAGDVASGLAASLNASRTSEAGFGGAPGAGPIVIAAGLGAVIPLDRVDCVIFVLERGVSRSDVQTSVDIVRALGCYRWGVVWLVPGRPRIEPAMDVEAAAAPRAASAEA